MTKLLDIYHGLPHPLRVGIANIRALQLKRRRYGPIFCSLLPGIRERSFWPRDQWEAWQFEQLIRLLQIAQEHTSGYAHLKLKPLPSGSTSKTFWPCGGNQARQLLSGWPVMDRRLCRDRPEDFLDRRRNGRELMVLHTSGTTGSPQRIFRDAAAEQTHYAYFEVRWRNLAGVSLKHRWAVIGGQLVVPITRRQPPFWVFNRPLNQLYLSSYHMMDLNGAAYLDALERFGPVYLYGYASSLHWLAQQAERLDRRIPMKLVLSNAEPLYIHQRALIQRAFQCDVRDTYGSAEGVAQGFECSAGRMHVSADYGIVEILNEAGEPCDPGESGEIVATGLTNQAMPLVRYRTGDAGAWADDQECSCGCTFPVLAQIEGRMDDLLQTADGRSVGRLDPVFKGDLPIREAQIIQRRDLRIEVLVVPEPTFTSHHEGNLIQELSARLGEGLPISVIRVQAIPRTARGKFRAVVRERGPAEE